MAGRDFSAELFGPSAGRDFSAELFGAKPPEKQSALRQVADIPLGIAKGAVQGVRMIADAFGAGSEASKTIKGAEDYLADLMSAQAKNDQREISRIMKDAEDKGVLDQVKAGIRAFTIAPVDTLSTALGTAGPVIVGALGAKVLGAGALVSTGVSVLTGAGLGAGAVKGSIYEETKRALKDAGAEEDVAEQKAQLAQEYGGKNLDQILLGTVLGGAAAVGPLEKGAAGALARAILGKAAVKEGAESVSEKAAKGAIRRRVEAGALEALPEAVQAGQEQVAQNIALQREGFDVPTFRGAFSAATMEALAGAGLGATIGGGRPEAPPAPEIVSAPEPAPAPPAPPVGALEFKPEPYIQFPDGTVAKQSEVEAYIKTLPEDQQMAMRTKLLGLAPQEADKEPEPPVRALEFKPEPLIVYPDGSVAKRSEVDAYIQGLPEDEQIPARAKLLGMGEETTQVTPEMLRKLGIRGRAPVIQRLSGVELTDPKVTEELTNFAQQPFASPEVRGNIFGFLNTLKTLEAPKVETPKAETPLSPPARPIEPPAAPPVEPPKVEAPTPPAQPPSVPKVEAAAPPAFESKIVSRQPAPDGMEVHVFTTTDGYGTGLFDVDAGQYVNGSVTRFAGADTLPKAEARAAEMLRKATPVETPSPFMQRLQEYWKGTVTPAVKNYLDAFNSFGVDRLEANQIKPAGMSAREWLESFVSKQSTWDKGRKTGETGIQALSTKNLWPTTDASGERLRKAMLDAVKALKNAPGSTSELVDQAFGESKPTTTAAPKVEAPVTPAANVEEQTTPTEEAKDIVEPTIRSRLKEIARNLGVLVFETGDKYSSGNGVVNIPTEDKQVEGAQSPEHVFAHELGHAILQNRSMTFNGMPNAEVAKWITGWDGIKAISKAFRPEIHNHKLPKFRRHANKPDEIIADALGSFLLGNSSKQDIAPLIKALNLNDFDLGIKARPVAAEVSAPKAEAPAVEAPAAPPTLDTTGIKEVKGRHPQVQAAAKLLQDKKMTREEFEKYVDYYRPIEEVEADKLLPPTSEQRMNETVNADKRDKINVPVADGTKVGLRMDLPARERGGSVVSIHEGKPGKLTVGKLMGFRSTGWLKDVTFEVRSQEKGLAVATGAAKAPQQTVEGTWFNLSPEETYARVKELMKDPAWTQVGFDPSRHGYFYDRKTREPVVSASEMYQVGQFLLAKDVKYAPKTDFLYSLGKEQTRQLQDFQQTLRNLLNKFGLKDVGLNIEEGMRDAGSYSQQLIRIASDEANPIRTLRHEAIHALRELGFFTDAQWKSLSKMAKDKWIDQYLKQRNEQGRPLKAGEESRYAAYMREYSGDMEKIIEEAVADAFADFDATKPPSGMLQALLKRMKDLFQSIKSALTKIESPEQIFGKIEKGELKVTKAPEKISKAPGKISAQYQRMAETSDGYKFYEQPDGTWSDQPGPDQSKADIVFDSIDDLFADNPDLIVDGKYYSPVAEKKDRERGEIRRSLGKVTSAAQKVLQKQPMPERGLSHVSTDLKNIAQPIFFPQNKTIIDRIDGMKDRFWQRLAQKTADQFRTIKEYSPLGYMQARLSKSIDGSLEGLLFHGQVFDDGGALNIKSNTKGMMDILKPIGNELDSYLMWVALNREARLPEDKRSKIANMDQLVARRSEFAAGELNGKPRVEVYQDVLRQMNQLNKSVLDIALAKGLIDQKGYDKFSNDIYYIPFYKKMEEDGTIEGAQTASGLTSQYFSKELKGSEAPFGDLMENIVRNWSHILSASMKNAAAKTTIDDAVKLQAAEPNLKTGLEWRDGKVYSTKTDKPIEAKFDEDGKQIYAEGELRPDLTTSGTGMAKIMVNGQPMYFKVTDELLMDSISSIGYLGPKSKFLDVARNFKNMLQYGVTASPIFKVNNLIRDSVAAIGVSDLKKSPVYNVMTGISLSKKDSPTYISALAGGAIFNFGSAYEGDQAKLIKRLIDQGVGEDTILDTKDKITKALKNTWDAYQHLGDRSEAANRLALYKQLRDKGMSHLEASFMARDLLDFSMQGSWPAFRLITQVVPFMNARIQGLYKLGRDGINPTVRVLYNATTGKEIDANDKIRAAQFATVSTAVMLASALLYLTFKDDEDFKKRDAWDRDNFWWFKIPTLDIAFRVPKPFEIGAFGTLVERSLEQILDQGAEGKQFADSLTRTLWDTFALNPTPQMFKPLVDIYANKDSFSGAPIESAGLERLSKQERMTDQTSPLAIALGGLTTLLPEKFEMSPVQVDYAIKGYFGWLGAMASLSSTYAVMPFKQGEYPDARWLDRASLGLVRDLPAPQSAYVTSFYENAKEISQAYADMRHYREMGDAESVQKILEKQGDKVMLAKFYDKTSKTIANVRKQIQIITNDPTLDGATKKEEIERMKLIMSDLAKQAEEVRKSMKP